MGGKRKHRKSGHWRKTSPGSGGPSRLYRSDPELEMLGILDLICYRLNSILAMSLIPLGVRNSIDAVIREIRERFIPAVSQRPDATFSPGDQVAVVSYDAGTAQVISREEYEFLHDQR